MVKAFGKFVQGLGLAFAAVFAAPIIALSELASAFSSFIG